MGGHPRGPGELEVQPGGREGLFGGPKGFWRPTQKSGRGLEAHPEVREGSGGSRRSLRGVVRPTQRPGRGRDTHTEFQEGSGGPSGGLGGVGRPSRWDGRCWQVLLQVR